MEKNFRPFTLHWNDQVPIDISFVFEHEKPAGKHGFLTVQGEQLVFADGAPGRFWGTNFNSGANFPEHAYAEMVARRLAKFGVNIVRTHQMDAEWATPNIFQFNRLRPKDHTRSLDPESLDRLDYLFYCLKQQGIYIYLDLLTYRQFKPGDGVDAVASLPQAAKPYHYFDPRLIELQKEFNETCGRTSTPTPAWPTRTTRPSSCASWSTRPISSPSPPCSNLIVPAWKPGTWIGAPPMACPSPSSPWTSPNPTRPTTRLPPCHASSSKSWKLTTGR